MFSAVSLAASSGRLLACLPAYPSFWNPSLFFFFQPPFLTSRRERAPPFLPPQSSFGLGWHAWDARRERERRPLHSFLLLHLLDAAHMRERERERKEMNKAFLVLLLLLLLLLFRLLPLRPRLLTSISDEKGGGGEEEEANEHETEFRRWPKRKKKATKK